MSSLSGGNVAQGLIVDANTLLGQQMDKPTQQAGVSESSQQPSDAQQKLQTFWLKQTEEIQNLTSNDFKTQELPLARIKKIMKMDEDVKMIAAEAPLLFSKAAQIFITELSLRAWIHTEDSKRRTLQRNDIATAITKFDQFDFLIDIVPREELKPPKRPFGASTAGDPVPFFYTLPQQTASTNTVNTSVASLHQGTAPVSTLQSGQILVAQPSQPGQPLSLTPVNLENVQQQQTTQQQNQPAVVLNTQQPDNTQLQKQDDGTANQSKEQKQQNAQAILQQLMSNLPAVGPGEVHTIQINSQGQLQLVKTQTNQAQTGTTEEGQSGRRLIAGNNGQMFELTGVEEPARHSDADGSNQGTIYVQQEN